MTHVAYVMGGYLATVAVLAVYAGWMRARARALSAMLPSEAAATAATEDRAEA